MNLPQPPFLLITDRKLARGGLQMVVAEAMAGGCRFLMIREKDLSTEKLSKLVGELIKIIRPYHATVVLSGNPELAAASGAAGVHLPQGHSVYSARHALGEGALIGVSSHSLAEVLHAAEEGADYVTLSPIFPSISKPGYGPPLGLEVLRRAGEMPHIPILALGGITPENTSDCLRAGAAGIAVLGAVMEASNACAITRKYIEQLARIEWPKPTRVLQAPR